MCIDKPRARQADDVLVSTVDYRDLWGDLLEVARKRRADTVDAAIKSQTMEDLAEHRGRAKAFAEIAIVAQGLLKAARGERDEGSEDSEEHEEGLLGNA